ncbi:MAG: PGF-pre-PGF domain-containing protein [Candidatus Hadarchaeales archaeon]
MGAIIEEFSVTPNEALPGEVVEFYVRLRNVGDLPIDISGVSRVEISLAGSTVKTLYFTPPGESIPPEGEVELTLIWTVENITAENYQATAVIIYDDHSVSSSTPFSVLEEQPPLPPEVIVESELVENAKFFQAGPENPAVFNFSALVIRRITVVVSESIDDCSVTVYQFGSVPPGSLPAIPAVPYKYFRVDVSGISEDAVSSVTLFFSVEKSWLSVNFIDESSVRMYRYIGNTWRPLPTSKTGENVSHVFYSAESDGLSYFGIGGLVLPVEEYLSWELRPILVEMVQGETRFLDVKIKNNGSVQLSGITVALSGTAENMATFVPGAFTLAALEEVSLAGVFSVSGNTSPGDYWLRFRASSGNAAADAVAIIRVKQCSDASPVLTRTVEIDGADYSTNVFLHVVNSRLPLSSVEITEGIPKTMVASAEEVSFDPEPEILESDPVVRWALSGIQSYERRRVSYSVGKIEDELAPLFYWQVKQLTAIYETGAAAIQVVRLYSKQMFLGGTGEIHVCLNNITENTVPVRVRLELPPGWDVKPAEIIIALEPGVESTIIFTVANPQYAEYGVYMGELVLVYGGERHVKSITLIVGPEEGNTGLIVIVAVIVVVAIVIFLIARKIKRRREMISPDIFELIKRK